MTRKVSGEWMENYIVVNRLLPLVEEAAKPGQCKFHISIMRFQKIMVTKDWMIIIAETLKDRDLQSGVTQLIHK